MRALAFGAFDPLHEGHLRFFEQARSRADELLVVVARDSSIQALKQRRPRAGEEERLKKVAACPMVDQALLGDEWPNEDPYRLLSALAFDILVLGYDQEPGDDVVRAELARRGREEVQVMRLAAWQPEVFKSSRLAAANSRYDLHLHSTYSDGDLTARALVKEAARQGLAGISLTDHNGVWGCEEAAQAAKQANLVFVEGIEVSARWRDRDLHVLGYSRSFDREKLSNSLAATREGYAQRAQEMVKRARAQGFDRVSFDALTERRAGQKDPVYGSYDVARELTRQHGVSVAEARHLVTDGGPLHVSYGDWAFSPAEAARVIRAAGGVAVLAHPGLIAHDAGEAALRELLGELVPDQLDGLEVFYPYHDKEMVQQLLGWVNKARWFATGGSDWHGPSRYSRSDEAFGRAGLNSRGWEVFLAAVTRATA